MPGTNSRAELRTLPNVLSVSRLILAALFVIAGSTGRVVLIIAAAVSDFLDGWLARRSKVESRWGAIIDPIGDRAFVFVALTTSLVSGDLSIGQFLILLTRDIATLIGFIVARTVSWLRPVALKARLPGKAVTVLQLAALLTLSVRPEAVTPFVALVGAASAWAIADYTLALWRARAR